MEASKEGTTAQQLYCSLHIVDSFPSHLCIVFLSYCSVVFFLLYCLFPIVLLFYAYCSIVLPLLFHCFCLLYSLLLKGFLLLFYFSVQLFFKQNKPCEELEERKFVPPLTFGDAEPNEKPLAGLEVARGVEKKTDDYLCSHILK